LLLISISALLGAAVVYSPLVASPHFADDLLFVLPDKPVNPLELLSSPSPTGHYRPLETMVHAWTQRFFGLNPVPIHLVTLGAHVMFAALCGAFAYVMTRRAVIGVAAALYMAVAQTNVIAAGSLDTLSQVLSALFGYLSLLLFAIFLGSGEAAGRQRIIRPGFILTGAVLSLALALLSKETGFGFAIADLAVVFVALWRRRTPGSPSVVTLAGCLGAIIVVAAIYLVVRAQVASFQPGIGQERWSFHLGGNVPVNLALLGFLAALPISSVVIYDAAKNSDFVLASTGALLALVVAAPVAGGLHGRLGTRGAAGLLLYGAAAVLPVIVLHRISEHYAYSLTPLVAIGLALAIWKFGPRIRGGKAIATLLFAAALTLNATATYQRASQLDATATSADMMLASLADAVKPAAPGARIILVDRRSEESGYSVFKLSGFELISSADGHVPPKQVAYLIGRPDLDIILVLEGDLSNVQRLPGDLRLTVDASGRLQPFNDS
jgi:hypothetical protein